MNARPKPDSKYWAVVTNSLPLPPEAIHDVNKPTNTAFAKLHHMVRSMKLKRYGLFVSPPNVSCCCFFLKLQLLLLYIPFPLLWTIPGIPQIHKTKQNVASCSNLKRLWLLFICYCFFFLMGERERFPGTCHLLTRRRLDFRQHSRYYSAVLGIIR